MRLRDSAEIFSIFGTSLSSSFEMMFARAISQDQAPFANASGSAPSRINFSAENSSAWMSSRAAARIPRSVTDITRRSILERPNGRSSVGWNGNGSIGIRSRR